MARIEHVGGAPPTSLASGVDSSTLTIPVVDGSGYPTGNIGLFYIVIDKGTSNEEKVLCASRTGNTITVAAGGRGADDTVAVSHPAAATVAHIFTAQEADDANLHIESDTDVHGVSGNVVGTSGVQVIADKQISGAANQITNLPQSATIGLENRFNLNEAAMAADRTDLANHNQASFLLPAYGTSLHGLGTNDGSVVGTTKPQTLEQKVISGADNTFSDIEQSSLVRYALRRRGGGGTDTLVPGTHAIGSFATQVQVGAWDLGGLNTWQFRVPVTGLYQINFKCKFDNTSTSQSGVVTAEMRSGMTAGTDDTGTITHRPATRTDNVFSHEFEFSDLYPFTAGVIYGFSYTNSSSHSITRFMDDIYLWYTLEYRGPST